jgi:hypothetical protein
MAIASRLRHDVVIRRWTAGTTTTGRGHKDPTYVDDAAIKGNIQRRSSREVSTGESGGVATSDAIGFLPIGTTVTQKDRLVESGSVYGIVGPARDAGGRGRHLELDLEVIVP